MFGNRTNKRKQETAKLTPQHREVRRRRADYGRSSQGQPDAEWGALKKAQASTSAKARSDRASRFVAADRKAPAPAQRKPTDWGPPKGKAVTATPAGKKKISSKKGGW